MKIIRVLSIAILFFGILFWYFNFQDYRSEKEFIEQSIVVEGTISRIGVPSRKFPDKGRKLFISYQRDDGREMEISVVVQSWDGRFYSHIKDGEIGDKKYVHIFPSTYRPEFAHINRRVVSDDQELEAKESFLPGVAVIGISVLGIVLLVLSFSNNVKVRSKHQKAGTEKIL
jgi:hypothetical protein